MIECDICREFFHPDEIKDCPNVECTKEMCESCYDEHVKKCLNAYSEDEEEDDYQDYEDQDYEYYEDEDDYEDKLGYIENRNTKIFQKALQGLGFDKDEFDKDKIHIVKVARENERLGDLGEALIETLTDEELEGALADLILEYDKNCGHWIISYIDK